MSITNTPPEVLTKIFGELDIGTIDNVANSIGTTPASAIAYDRNNPHTYLRQLTPRTELLLRLMRATRTVLSGSRAAGYFYRSATAVTSDWDFYADGTGDGRRYFMMHMEALGTVWATPQPEADPLGYDGEMPCAIARGVLNDNVIQLMWLPHTPAFDSILRFHSTVVQCFITGFCAVSMYHFLSSKGKNVCLPYSNDHEGFHMRTEERLMDAWNKYEGRGFLYTTVDEADELSPWTSKVTHKLASRGTLKALAYSCRQVSDQGCKVIDFASYISHESSHEKTLVKSMFDMLLEYEWAHIVNTVGDSRVAVCTVHIRCAFLCPDVRPEHIPSRAVAEAAEANCIACRASHRRVYRELLSGPVPDYDVHPPPHPRYWIRATSAYWPC